MKDTKTEVINTTEQIQDLVDWLVFRHASAGPAPPTMFIDLEGVNLCREGSVSILTLLLDTGIPTGRVCLIDVLTLGARAFTTAGAKQKTLKDILQDEKIPKVFFDVRNDSDALYSHFGIALQGIEDVQLMENASRKTTASRRLLNGLARCIDGNVFLNFGGSSKASWKLTKNKGERLFKPELGGSYAVFNTRPIPEDIVAYCVGDVEYLPELREKYWTRQNKRWQDLVEEESKKRVALSHRPDYQPHGRDRALAPWSKEQNTILDECSYVPPSRTYSDELFDPYDDHSSTDDDRCDYYPMNCRDVIDSDDYCLYYDD